MMIRTTKTAPIPAKRDATVHALTPIAVKSMHLETQVSCTSSIFNTAAGVIHVAAQKVKGRGLKQANQ